MVVPGVVEATGGVRATGFSVPVVRPLGVDPSPRPARRGTGGEPRPSSSVDFHRRKAWHATADPVPGRRREDRGRMPLGVLVWPLQLWHA